MVINSVEATDELVTVKFAVFEPAGMVTVAGTVASGDEEVRVTSVPVPEAFVDIVTVPVVEVPPTIVDGFNVTEETVPMLAYFVTKPAQLTHPQPESISQPTVALDVVPSGSVPLVPDVMSKNTLESPLR